MLGKEEVKIRKSSLVERFSKTRNAFSGYEDERQYFCSTYDTLIAALDEMRKVNNYFVWAAFDTLYERQKNALEFLERQFLIM